MKYGIFIFLGFFSSFIYANDVPDGTPADIPGKRIARVVTTDKDLKGDNKFKSCSQILDVLVKRSPNANIRYIGSSYSKPYYDQYNGNELSAPRFICRFSSNGRGVLEQFSYSIEFILDHSLCARDVRAAFKSNLSDPPDRVCGDNKCWFNIQSWEKTANAGKTDENGQIPKFWGFGIQTGVACAAKTDLGDAVPSEPPKPPYNPDPPKDPPPPLKKGCDEGQAMCEQPEGGCGEGFTSGTFNGKAMCIANGKPNSPPPDTNNGGGGDASSSGGGGVPNSGGSNPDASIPNPYLPNTTPSASGGGGGAVGGATGSNGSSSANGNHANGGNSGTGGVSFGGHVNGNPNSDNRLGNANGDAKDGGKEGQDEKGKGGKGDGDGDSYPDLPDNPALPLIDLGKNMKLSENIFNSRSSCPADRTLRLSNFSYTFSFSQWCEYLRVIGYLILIASYIYAINIVSRDI